MDIDSSEAIFKENGVEIHTKQVVVTIKEHEAEDVKMDDVSTPTESGREDKPKARRTTKPQGRRMLFTHLPSVKDEALGSFEEIKQSAYQHDDLGESSQQFDVMSCECKPQITGLKLPLSPDSPSLWPLLCLRV
jgi:hypothetical protein